MLLSFLFISLILSVFFAGIEISFMSSNKLRLELYLKETRFPGTILKHFFDHLFYFTTSLQAGYFLSIVTFTLLFTKLIFPSISTFVSGHSAAFASLLVIDTCAMLLIGELIPRVIFRRKPNAWISTLSFPIAISYLILSPLSKGITILIIKSLSIIGIKRTEVINKEAFGKVDLDNMIKKSIDEASIGTNIEPEVKIFRNALDFTQIKLRDCIVPRPEVVAVEWNEKQEKLLDIFIETGLSKIIVFRENFDNILGYIHASEMFERPEDWHTCITQIPLVPETMTANKLMKQLMSEKKSIAAVLDEFGSVSGIVTMEDLVEEIFGEIEDEHDTQTYISRQVNESEYIFSGGMEVEKINSQYMLHLEKNDGYVTLAGLILFHHHKFPKQNETVDIGEYSYKILKASTTRIDLVRLKVR